MSTYSGNLVPNAGQTQESYSSGYYIHFNTPGTSMFTVNSIAAANGNVGDTVVVHLENSGGEIQEATVKTENAERMYYDVGLSISVPESGWVFILLKQYGSDVYWDYVSTGLPFGNTGSGSTISTISAYDLIFTAEYNTVWTLDSQNDSYPYPTGTDPTEFTEFTKDRDGYPTNLGVWKLDENNEGYPWVSGFTLIRREVLMKFINDTVLNNLVQKINSIFRINSHNNIQHTDLNVRKLDAQKIDINGATRIETTNSGAIKLGNTLTNSDTNTSVLSISGDEVTVRRSLDSYNIKSHWISRHKGLILSSFSESEADLLANGYPHLKLESSRIVISGDGDKSGSETNSSYITVDSDDSIIKLSSNNLSIHSDNIVIYDKLTIKDYINVETSHMVFRVSNDSVGMYTDPHTNDFSDLDGEKIRLNSRGLITLCGRNYIRMGISQAGTEQTFYETIIAHYGIDYRWLHLTCPNSYVSLQLETDKAYYKKTSAARTANDEIATIGDITSRIQESDAMQYKGSINASADLPTVSNTTNNVKVGATYKVATTGSYSYYNGTATVTQSCKVGDLFIAQAIASGTTKTITWDYIPAADDVLALSYITSGTPTISTTAQTGTSLTLGSVVTKMFETTLTNTDANVPTSKAVQTYVSGGYIPNVGNTTGDDFELSRDIVDLSFNNSFIVEYGSDTRINSDDTGIMLSSDGGNAEILCGWSANDEININAAYTQIDIIDGITYSDTSTSSKLTGFKVRYEVDNNDIIYQMFGHTANGDLISNLTSPTTIELVAEELEQLAEMGYTGKVIYNGKRINIDESVTYIDIQGSSHMVIEFNNCTFNWTISQAFEPSYNKWVFNNCKFIGNNPSSGYNLYLDDEGIYEFNSCTFSGCAIGIDHSSDIRQSIFNRCIFSIGTGKFRIISITGSDLQYSESQVKTIFTDCINLNPIIETSAVTKAYVDDIAIIGCYMSNSYVAPSKPFVDNKYYNNSDQITDLQSQIDTLINQLNSLS